MRLKLRGLWAGLATVAAISVGGTGCGVRSDDELNTRIISVVSSMDGAAQPARFWAPPGKAAAPLLLSLYSWSTHYDRYDGSEETLRGCQAQGWAFLSPEFRGPNNRPEACASDLAVQDVLDAVDHACTTAQIDPRRIYVLGGSGGGYMALMMACRAPERWAAVSAWVPITDLAAWHAFCAAKGSKYAEDIERCLGGPPGDADRDAEYRRRSPLFGLERAKGLAVDLEVGIQDGHTGSVPIEHTLRAFDVLARANGHEDAAFADADIAVMAQEARIPDHLAAERAEEPGRAHRVLLRRNAGPVRLTVFDGGHEIDPAAALSWLNDHVRGGDLPIGP